MYHMEAAAMEEVGRGRYGGDGSGDAVAGVSSYKHGGSSRLVTCPQKQSRVPS